MATGIEIGPRPGMMFGTSSGLPTPGTAAAAVLAAVVIRRGSTFFGSMLSIRLLKLLIARRRCPVVQGVGSYARLLGASMKRKAPRVQTYRTFGVTRFTG